MSKYICEECEHFRQYYAKYDYVYRPVACGHCNNNKVKQKKIIREECEFFKLKNSITITKELKEEALKNLMDLFGKINDLINIIKENF